MTEFATPLCEMAARYGTDKLANGYTPYYYELLRDNRESFRKVLELGIGTPKRMYRMPNYQVGASLRMWRDFFPNAVVYGADNDPQALFDDDRIETMLCDERRVRDLMKMVDIAGRDIDLFIDDARHEGQMQIATCLTLMPFFGKDVVYVIEDVSLPEEVVDHLEHHGYDCQEMCTGKRRCNLVVVRHRREV